MVLKQPVQLRLDEAELAIVDRFAADLSSKALGATITRAEALKIAALTFLKDRQAPPVVRFHPPGLSASPTTEDAPTAEGFDPEKYVLGIVCPQGHVWQASGLTLRDKRGHCLECERIRKRKKPAVKA